MVSRDGNPDNPDTFRFPIDQIVVHGISKKTYAMVCPPAVLLIFGIAARLVPVCCCPFFALAQDTYARAHLMRF